MIKKLKQKFYNLKISTRLILYFLIIFSLFSVLLYNIIPVILNYPPGAINSAFDKEVSTLYYGYQFLIVVLSIAIFFTSYLKISLRKVDHWWKTRNEDLEEIAIVRKKALTFPYSLYISMEIFPTIIVLLTLMLTGSHPSILLFKIGTIIFTLASVH